MPVRRTLLALVLIATALPAVGSVPEAQSGPSLVVGLGAGGFTPTDRPSEMAVTITTPVLIAGRLRVRGGDIAVSRPVEVPAGSELTYRLTLPPLNDGTRLNVEVVDGDGEALVAESITTRSRSGEEMAVGVMGSDDLVDLLGRVRTVVTDRPVAAFPVPIDIPDASLDVLDYLVVARQGGDGAEAALAWARSGGRVVIDSSFDLEAEMGDAIATGVEGVARGRVGSGAVLAVDGMEGRSAEEWAAILRPAPLDLASSPDGMMGDNRSLLQAASEAGDRQVPSIPWLLFAIIGFAVMVGPVNFFVLARIGKRDWAWVTIPAVALIAVVGFWVAGRQRIAGTNLTHASFIAEEGGIEARSAVLVAAGVAGERRLSFESGTDVYPERSLMGASGTELEIVDDQTVTVELDQLGFTGIGLHTRDPGIELPRVSVEGDRLRVDNTAGLTFWGWGAMMAGASTVADSELAPGSSDEVAVPRGAGGEFGFGFIDALVNRRQLWEDPSRNNSLWPLSQLLFTEADENGVYFVGITDDFQPAVSTPGATGAIPGPTLVMVKADTVVSGSTAAATVVDTGFINWIDWGAQRVISTDELTVRFQLPDPSVTAEFTDARRFGGGQVAYEAWDWGGGEFTSIEVGEPLPPAVVSGDGEVYVRLVGANEFGDNPMSPSDLALEWET
jgi:hypothetical protein